MFFKGYNVYFTSDEAAIAKILSSKAGDKNESLATFSNGIYLNFTDSKFISLILYSLLSIHSLII